MTSPILVRTATPSDMDELTRLLRHALRRYPRGLNCATQDLGSDQTLVAAWSGQTAEGYLALRRVRPTAARVEAIVLRRQDDTARLLSALLRRAENELQEQEIESIVYVGEDTWPTSDLRRQGFHEHSSILLFRKRGWAIPDRGNQSVRLRCAETRDVPALVRLDEAAFVEDLWRNDADAFLRCLERMPHFMVALQDEEVVGYQFSQIRDRDGYLARIAVHPLAQGRRIGVRLVSEAIEFFRRRRAYRITLNTQTQNRSAQRLYEWFGFQLIGQEIVVLQRRTSSSRSA